MAFHYHLFKYLRTKKHKTHVDKLMSFAAVLHPLSALPQVIQVYRTKEAAGLSIVMWLGFLCLGFIFLSYGIAHRLKPYIMMQILWLITDVAMIVGILKYA